MTRVFKRSATTKYRRYKRRERLRKLKRIDKPKKSFTFKRTP